MLTSNYRKHISRGLILLFIFYALQAAFVQPAAHASDTSVTDVLVEPLSFYAGTTTEYTFRFKPLTALSGGDKITIELPHGVSLGPAGIDGIYESGGLSILPACITIEDLGVTKVELDLGTESSVNAGEVVEIIVGINNPNIYGKYEFLIYTSTDRYPMAFEVPIIETSIPELMVTPYDSRVTEETPYLYKFEFISMAPIRAYNTQIILFFPPEVLAAAAIPQYGNALIVQGSHNIGQYEIDKQSGTITFTANLNIDSLTPVTITLDNSMGLKNPATTGYGSFSIKTSGDLYPTTNNYVYFHSSEGAMLEDVVVQEVYENDISYLQVDFTNHIDLSDYVQINFPYNVNPNPFETNATISIGGSTAVSTTTSLTYSSFRIYIPERIKANTSSTIMIPFKDNMSLTTGAYNVNVHSSNEMRSFEAPLDIEERQVQSLMIVPNPVHVGVESGLEINFTTNRKLYADESKIIVEFPIGATFPNEITAEGITINGEALGSVLKVDDQTLILTVPQTVEIGADVSIVFSQDFGITNPSTPGQYVFNVKVDDGNNNQFSAFTVLYYTAPSGGTPDPGAPASLNYVRFVDQDSVAGRIAGIMEWHGPEVQTGIDSYSIFFINSSGGIVSEIKNVPVDLQKREYSVQLTETEIPTGATRVGVRWNNGDAHGDMFTNTLWDDPIHYPLGVRYEDTNLSAGTMNGILTWNKSPSESGISYYRISYRTTYNEDVLIALVPANGSASYTYAIPEEIVTSQAVLYLNMVNEHGEFAGDEYHVIMMDYTSASSMPPSTVREDLSAPKDVFYFDDDNEIGNQVGYMYWNDPAESSNITGYQLSYVKSNGTTQVFAQVKRNSFGQYKIYLSSISNGPSGVTIDVQSISIRSTDSEGNVSAPVIVDIEDQSSSDYRADYIQFYDFDMTSDELAGSISWVHPPLVSLFKGYEIYFIDDYYRRISKIGAVTISTNQFIIPSNTLIPAGATRIGIFSKGNVLLSIPGSIGIQDSTVNTNYSPLYRSKLTSVIDVNKNGLEIDDVVKYLAAQYDMNGDNVFDAADVGWMLELLIPMQVID
jgi:hypothetical protein